MKRVEIMLCMNGDEKRKDDDYVKECLVACVF